MRRGNKHADRARGARSTSSTPAGDDSHRGSNGRLRGEESSSQEKPTHSKLNQQTSLTNKFLIGEELGFGAFSKVFKGVDLQNGDFVAIKQISLEGVAEDNQDNIVKEIDLLRNLNHKNIVKYFGSYRTSSHLYIILEYVENGSLSQIIKPNKFGAFPESLAAVYMKQTLEGLAYLHEQRVIHRDIKGGNILTTKEGIVKLADFGVATMSTQREGTYSASNPVVGTPYWMAPEVIEMSGVTFSSDIWSVGATAIELLTGKPPYFDMMPMSALFHIVQDEHPPVPEGVSPEMRNFLMECFQKEPKKRPSAKDLLEHEWFQKFKSSLEWTGSGKRSPLSFRPLDTPDSKNSGSPASSIDSQSQFTGSASTDKSQHSPNYQSRSTPRKPQMGGQEIEYKVLSVRGEGKGSSLPRFLGWLHKRTSSGAALGRSQDAKAMAREDYFGTVSDIAQTYTVIPKECETKEERILMNRQLTEEVKRLIAMMRPEKREGIILSACQQCIALLVEHPFHKATFKANRGVVALHEILSKGISPPVAHSALQLLNVIVVAEDENGYDCIAATGIIPQAMKYISPAEEVWNVIPVRREATQFARNLCLVSTETLQSFLACNGLGYIAQLLHDICSTISVASSSIENLQLVELVIDCLWSMINTGEVIQTDDTCRLLSNVGVETPLIHALKMFTDSSEGAKVSLASPHSPSALVTKIVNLGRSSYENVASLVRSSSPNTNGEDGKAIKVPSPGEENDSNNSSLASPPAHTLNNGSVATPTVSPGVSLAASEQVAIADIVASASTYLEKTTGLLLVLSCSDSIVKSHLSEKPRLLQMLLESARVLRGNTQLMILALIKQLSEDPGSVDKLAAVGVVPVVVPLLAEFRRCDEPQHALMVLEIFSNMAEFDSNSLEVAAMYGAVHSLCDIAYSDEEALPLVLPLLLSMSNSGRKCRGELWKNDGHKLFVHLLHDKAWQQKALEALITWLASDSRIEDYLLGKDVLVQLVACLQDKASLFALCHSLLLLCHRSPRLNVALSQNSEIVQLLIGSFQNTDPSNLLAILRFVDLLYQYHPSPKELIVEHHLVQHLQALVQDDMTGDMVMVMEKARSMLDALQMNAVM